MTLPVAVPTRSFLLFSTSPNAKWLRVNVLPFAGARDLGSLPLFWFPFSPAGGLAAPLVSSVCLWDQLEEGSLGTLPSLEEQVLNSTFEACDPQRTGWGPDGGQAALGPGRHKE